jgi:hypothetical protein
MPISFSITFNNDGVTRAVGSRMMSCTRNFMAHTLGVKARYYTRREFERVLQGAWFFPG